MNFRRSLALAALAAVPALAPSCNSPKRLPEVGIMALNTVVADSTTQLLEDIRAEDTATVLWLAYAGVDNMSASDLGAAKEDTEQVVTEILVNSKEFRMISERQVDAARRAAGISRVDDLTLREPRAKFLGVLTEQGRVPDYLMFGNFTSVDEDLKGGRLRRYRLTLQMLDSASGEVVAQRSGIFTDEARR